MVIAASSMASFCVRRLLLTIAVLLLVLMLVSPFVVGYYQRLQLKKFVGVLGVVPTKMMMEAPELFGYSLDGTYYSLHARNAWPDSINLKMIRFIDVNIYIQSSDKQEYHVSADNAYYNVKKQELRLTDNVKLYDQKGTALHLETTVVGLDNQHLFQGKGFRLQHELAVLKAQTVSGSFEDGVVHFRDRVQMKLWSNEGMNKREPLSNLGNVNEKTNNLKDSDE